MATQTVTEPPEEEMADAEERRRDDESGKVMTYAQVLEDNKDDTELAGTTWELMTPVVGTPPATPSGAMANLSLGQQTEEYRAQQAQQAAAKKAAAQQAAAQQATTEPDMDLDSDDLASDGSDYGDAQAKVEDGDEAAGELSRRGAGQAHTAAASHASAIARSQPRVLKLNTKVDARLDKAQELMAESDSLTPQQKQTLMELFKADDVSKEEAQRRKNIVNELKIANDAIRDEAKAERAIERHKKDAEAEQYDNCVCFAYTNKESKPREHQLVFQIG